MYAALLPAGGDKFNTHLPYFDNNFRAHTHKCRNNDCSYLFLHPKEMVGENKYFCGACHSKQVASRWIQMERLPQRLTLQLLRFVYDTKTLSKKKLKDPVQVCFVVVFIWNCLFVRVRRKTK
jgi:hypothetical protein